jgi:hypothetical protein
MGNFKKNKENINHSKNISTQIANKFFIPCRIKAYLDCQFISISEPEILYGSSPLLFVISCGVFSATNKIAMNDGEYIPSEDENLGGLHVGSIDNIYDVMDAEEVTNYSVQFGAADLILFILSDDISK